MEISDIKRIGEITLGDDVYESMRLFFGEIWESSFDYVAVFARRCFALHNLFMQSENVGQYSGAHRVTSDNALLLCADEFAEYYNNWHSFPSILLIDDLLIYGRNISRFLYNFEKLIINKLKELKCVSAFSDNELYFIHRDLADATTIRVFAMNKSPLLIRQLAERTIYSQNECYTNKLKELSQKISSFIQEVNEPNTHFRYSVLVPKSTTIEQSIWHQEIWSYRGEKRTVFFSPDSSRSFVAMAYTHGDGCLNSNNSVWITGLAVGGNIGVHEFDDICKTAVTKLRQYDKKYQQMISILEESRSLLQTQRTQLISFILSVIGVKVLLANSRILPTAKQAKATRINLEHIASNFGIKRNILPEFLNFDEAAELCSELHNSLYEKFKKYTANLFADEILVHNNSNVNRHQVNDITEDVFHTVGIAGEKEAYHIGKNVIPFRPDQRGADTISLTEYVDRIYAGHKEETLSPVQILAGLTAVVDSGLAALNFKQSDDGNVIQCMLKAGELSTFSMPRKLHWFIPALSLVEDAQYRLRMDPRHLIKKFIIYLVEIGPHEYWTVPVDPKEKLALDLLIEHGGDFTDTLYECGRTFGAWDTNLQTIGDWREEKWENEDFSYIDFVYRNDVRQRYYLHLANQFIKKFESCS